jgi:hypothetical protein
MEHPSRSNTHHCKRLEWIQFAENRDALIGNIFPGKPCLEELDGMHRLDQSVIAAAPARVVKAANEGG